MTAYKFATDSETGTIEASDWGDAQDKLDEMLSLESRAAGASGWVEDEDGDRYEVGAINLDDCRNWRHVEDIATYTACVYGPAGDQPGTCEVVLESGTVDDGVTVYRWTAQDDCGVYESGQPTLTRDKAIRDGQEMAAQSNDEPDYDSLVEQIIETGAFGDADADDIMAICTAATRHSQGHLLLPLGEPVAQPIGRMWTTNGYLECDHIALDATYPRPSHAAAGLLQAIQSREASCDE